MSNIQEIKEVICDICHKMWQLGWVAANDGNITVMLDDGTLLATPTGMSKSFITPEKLIRIDRKGNVLEAAEGLRPDVIVVDPPRKGCSPDVLAAIHNMAPQKLIYISCNVASLARDAKELANLGYKAAKAVPVDLFPRTNHVETAMLFERG